MRRKEAEKNNEAARLWISGLEAVNRKLGVVACHRPVGHAVLPQRLGLRRRHAVPVDDERLLADGRHRMRHREAAARAGRGKHSRAMKCRCTATCGRTSARTCRRRGAAQGEELDPLKLPTRLQTALEALYGHYEKTFKLWENKGIRVPPCFIIVCQNTAISKLVYDFISGFQRKKRRRHHHAGQRSPRPLSQLRRHHRQPAPAPQHAAHRQRATRSRRCARRQLPGHGGRRNRTLSPRDRRAHR